jgi:G3E family GTPase
MRIIIIAGFLGSGKTTLLLSMARQLSSATEQLAIIENEIGEIGIDGQYLNHEGLQVQELLGGCICCTLSMGLIETLEKLNHLYQPALTIVEATGAAYPEAIVDTVRKCRFAVESVHVITLVDAGRFDMLLKMMTPLLSAQIRDADTVILNKIDQVAPEVVGQIRQDISELNTAAEIHAVSLENQDLNSLMEQLI